MTKKKEKNKKKKKTDKNEVMEGMKGLNPQQQEFVYLYLFGEWEEIGNATECYCKAYNHQGKRLTASIRASQLMKDDNVKSAINTINEKKRQERTTEWYANKAEKIASDSEYARDRLKAVELQAKLEGKLQQDNENAGGVQFFVGIPRPERGELSSGEE